MKEKLPTGPAGPSAAGPVGRCGFYCGCCRDYVGGECEGCVPAHRESECYSRDCVERRGVKFCPMCPEFPCEALFQMPHATVLDKDWLLWQKKRKHDGA